ncbi:MAG TPA: S-formylglutathione hydrolase [Pseudomonadales bacterium]|nr:S-formylglutathione hydrolase [Pseudomonadales bacterium]
MEILEDVRCFDGRQLRIKHASNVCACDMIFSLYLPPQAAAQTVPVYWWLSGLTCTDQNFVTKAGAQRVASELGVAVIAPDTSPRGHAVPDDAEKAWDFGLGAGFYVNATETPWRSHYQMYDYVTVELPALVFAEFNLDRSRQAIFGHSMGGHGALVLGLRNPEIYRSISAFSPIVAPSQCPWGQKAFSGYLGADQNSWKQYDSCELITTLGYTKPILVEQGGADSFLQNQLKPELLQRACNAAGVTLTLNFRDGYDHSYYFISTFIESHMRFHWQNLL